MASVGELKEQLAEFNKQAKELAESIEAAKNDIEQPGEELAAALEGAESGIDQTVAGALEEAKRALDDAFAVLEQVQQSVEQYANSL